MNKIFESPILLFILGVFVLSLSIRDYVKNYSKSSYAGKSSIISFIGLGIIFLILSYLKS